MKSTFGHSGSIGVEAASAPLSEAGGITPGFLQNAGEDQIGKQSRVFGEQAENDAVEKMGHGGGVMAAASHGIRNLSRNVPGSRRSDKVEKLCENLLTARTAGRRVPT